MHTHRYIQACILPFQVCEHRKDSAYICFYIYYNHSISYATISCLNLNALAA